MARHQKRRHRDKETFNIWRSYSDMMAGVLLLFVLIMCVTLFQAQKNYVERLAEQQEKLRLQDEYQTAMLEKQEELDAQDAQLAEQQKKLEDQELTLDELQAALEQQAKLLADKQKTLEEQQITLEVQQSTLDEQQTQLNAQATTLNQQMTTLNEQQALLDAQSLTLTAQEKEIASKTQELKDKQAQIDRIIGVKADVIEALRQEFTSNNVNVKIDESTGALVLDSNVMFDYNDTTLSPEGEAVLRQVLPIYCRVLLSEDYLPNVGEIIIDGYTDTSGTYAYNLQLSQQRSLAVAMFLLDIENEFLDASASQTLRDILTVNGHSMSNPILDANGEIDMDASRRVEVKFRLKDEEMIEELRNLIE